MHSITSGFSYRVQSFHGSPSGEICLHSAHVVMLSRHNRYRFNKHIISFILALLVYMWKMLQDHISSKRSQIFPHMLRSIYRHLFPYFMADYITRLQFICKPFARLVKKPCAFASHRFRYQKSSSLIPAKQCCRVDLHIIQILYLYTMF